MDTTTQFRIQSSPSDPLSSGRLPISQPGELISIFEILLLEESDELFKSACNHLFRSVVAPNVNRLFPVSGLEDEFHLILRSVVDFVWLFRGNRTILESLHGWERFVGAPSGLRDRSRTTVAAPGVNSSDLKGLPSNGLGSTLETSFRTNNLLNQPSMHRSYLSRASWALKVVTFSTIVPYLWNRLCNYSDRVLAERSSEVSTVEFHRRNVEIPSEQMSGTFEDPFALRPSIVGIEAAPIQPNQRGQDLNGPTPGTTPSSIVSPAHESLSSYSFLSFLSEDEPETTHPVPIRRAGRGVGGRLVNGPALVAGISSSIPPSTLQATRTSELAQTSAIAPRSSPEEASSVNLPTNSALRAPKGFFRGLVSAVHSSRLEIAECVKLIRYALQLLHPLRLMVFSLGMTKFSSFSHSILRHELRRPYPIALPLQVTIGNNVPAVERVKNGGKSKLSRMSKLLLFLVAFKLLQVWINGASSRSNNQEEDESSTAPNQSLLHPLERSHRGSALNRNWNAKIPPPLPGLQLLKFLVENNNSADPIQDDGFPFPECSPKELRCIEIWKKQKLLQLTSSVNYIRNSATGQESYRSVPEDPSSILCPLCNASPHIDPVATVEGVTYCKTCVESLFDRMSLSRSELAHLSDAAVVPTVGRCVITKKLIVKSQLRSLFSR